ncbi:MAG TPA: glycerol-3-phosphate 1-O-acyltransferase PlsY [Abditibacteriaceae bacterium]|jgi:glycerol-3-phosphate acyltransferase PlsY
MTGVSGAAVFALALSYFLGAIPFGLIVGKARGVDIRNSGSGNIGATNVWRTLGPKAGALVFALDVAKGLAAPLLARALVGDTHAVVATCAAFAILGHTFSFWLRFRGGKGIATGFGAMLGLVPWVALGCLAAWGLALAASRMISVASIVACIVAPIGAYLSGAPVSYQIVIGALALVALIKHIPNMKRIAQKTEPKIGQKSTVDFDRPSAPTSNEAVSR